MSIKGARVTYAKFITSLSILKGTNYCQYELNHFRKMRNAILAFSMLIQNLSSTHLYISDFQTPSEMRIKEMK